MHMDIQVEIKVDESRKPLTAKGKQRALQNKLKENNCLWYHNNEDDQWEGSCDRVWPFLSGPAWHNCPHCGKFIVLIMEKLYDPVERGDDPVEEQVVLGKCWCSDPECPNNKSVERGNNEPG